MTEGLVSIVLPVYNVEAYLEQCIHSLLAQTYPSLELILVDDGSTDQSGALCDKLAKEDARIRVIHQENRGVSSARNHGMDCATGEYIGFVDPDDWIEPKMIQSLVEALRKNDAGGAFCGYWEQPETVTKTDRPILHAPEKMGTVSGSEALYQCLIGMGYGYFTSVWNKLFRRSAIEQKGALPRFDPAYSIAEDELWLTEVLPTLEQVELISEPLYYWRQRENSALHHKLNAQRWRTAVAAKKRSCELLRDDPRCGELAMGKVYNDIFHVVCLAYCQRDDALMWEFQRELEPYYHPFLHSSEFSKAKKARFLLLEWMIKLHFPRKLVSLLEDMTIAKIKQNLMRDKK